MSNTKVLFILKRKNSYDAYKDSEIGLSTGLYNSALYMNEMLNNSDVESNISVVVDNNDIDREVTKYRPTHVIIEALWVIPSKFYILSKLHPQVKWIIRLHSEIPFIANEGSAMDWIGDYVMYENVFIGTNAPGITKDLRRLIQIQTGWDNKEIKKKIVYLPNYYPQLYKTKTLDKTKDIVDVSCFGAIRPMKNQLIQAIASIRFAEKIGKKLNFHINVGRIEQKGDSVYSNLKGLFGHITDSGHQLIVHQWGPREEFLETCSKMDMGLQVSFSETFNIVAANLISEGVPVVSSKEIPWMNRWFTAEPTSSYDIYLSLLFTYYFSKTNIYLNQGKLKRYTNKSRRIWLRYFTD